MEPPYTLATNTASRNRMARCGSMLKLIGRRMARAMVELTPGMAPSTTPSTVPITASSRPQGDIRVVPNAERKSFSMVYLVSRLAP